MFKLRYVLLWALTIFGFAVMILGTVMAILTHSGSCTFKEAERYWCQSDHDGIIGNKTSNYTTVFSSTPLPMTNIPPTSFLSTITANMTN